MMQNKSKMASQVIEGEGILVPSLWLWLRSTSTWKGFKLVNLIKENTSLNDDKRSMHKKEICGKKFKEPHECKQYV